MEGPARDGGATGGGATERPARDGGATGGGTTGMSCAISLDTANPLQDCSTRGGGGATGDCTIESEAWCITCILCEHLVRNVGDA
jgi:hypothetical protein